MTAIQNKAAKSAVEQEVSNKPLSVDFGLGANGKQMQDAEARNANSSLSAEQQQALTDQWTAAGSPEKFSVNAEGGRSGGPSTRARLMAIQNHFTKLAGRPITVNHTGGAKDAYLHSLDVSINTPKAPLPAPPPGVESATLPKPPAKESFFTKHNVLPVMGSGGFGVEATPKNTGLTFRVQKGMQAMELGVDRDLNMQDKLGIHENVDLAAGAYVELPQNQQNSFSSYPGFQSGIKTDGTEVGVRLMGKVETKYVDVKAGPNLGIDLGKSSLDGGFRVQLSAKTAEIWKGIKELFNK